MSTRKGGLGRGLDSLIPTSLSEPITTNTGVTIADQGEVDINAIVPNPKQPRTIFDTEALAELSASIKEVGVLQPPVVRDIGGGKYELIDFPIPRAVRVSEAPSFNQTVMTYDASSPGAIAYMTVAREIARRGSGEALDQVSNLDNGAHTA